MPHDAVHSVDVATEDGVPIRLYLPETSRELPALVFLHGGGWTTGSVADSDELCRTLAAAAACAVASIEYRLAPEHAFPAGLDDCCAATAWLVDRGATFGLDTARCAIGGTSAGANLATAVARLARERGGPPLVFQLLVYPPLDHTATADVDGAAFRRADIAAYWSLYLREGRDGDDPRASPLRAIDLRGLPPALVISAELDPLAAEAEHYVRRLTEAGVPAELRCFRGAEHGFFSSPTLQGAAARTEAIAALRTAFASS
jgi:acetyl esterase